MLLKTLIYRASLVSQTLPLRIIIVVPFLLQIFVAVGLTGWLSVRHGQQAVKQLVTQLKMEVSDRTHQQLDQYFALPHQLTQMNLEAIESKLLNPDDLKTTGHYFWQQMQIFDVSYIAFASETGNYIGAYRKTNGSVAIDIEDESTQGHLYSYATDRQGNFTQRLEVIKNHNHQQLTWYNTAVTAGKPTWSPIVQWQQPEHIFSMPAVVPVYDERRNLMGVLGVDRILSQVSDFLKTLKISPSGKVFIIERNGLLVASSSDAPITHRVAGKIQRLKASDSRDSLIRFTAQELTKTFGNLNQIQQSQPIELNRDRQRQFVQVTPWRDQFGLDWLVVVVIPEADFMGQIHANTRTTIGLCFVALVIASWVGIGTSNWISQPILQLSHKAEALAQGDWHQILPITRGLEVRILAQAFNRMALQLQQTIAALEKSKANLELQVEERTALLKQTNCQLRQEILERQQAEESLRVEQEKSERLLLNILPEAIATQLKHNPGVIAEYFENVTILFADIVGFTPLSSRLSPIKLVNLLNQIFSCFDQLAQHHGLEKIKTIGDAYMVASGLPLPRADHAQAIAEMALDMQQAITQFTTDTDEPFQMRIGIHTGAVVAGVIGMNKFVYDLWGDTVNVASRMESQGLAGSIQVTQATYDQLHGQYRLEKRGVIEVKGKGKMMTYWLIEKC